MALSLDEAADIKSHLLKKLGNFPLEGKDEIREKIESMPIAEVEDFIRDNKLTHLGNQCIFCSIIASKTPSFKIVEDKTFIAILEINPLSKGHTLVIPKAHDGDVGSDYAKGFAKEVAQMLAKKLNPKEVRINALKIMDHPLLEITPLFGNESERWQASPEELKSLQEEIVRPLEPVRIEEKNDEVKVIPSPILHKLPPRIP